MNEMVAAHPRNTFNYISSYTEIVLITISKRSGAILRLLESTLIPRRDFLQDVAPPQPTAHDSDRQNAVFLFSFRPSRELHLAT
jgi:hypothetical protein